MDDRSNELADFLRTRRARVTPDQAGLPEDGRARRVPGLRRDEVARLAGVSTEYYTRIEQGRAQNPSPEVLEALAGTLRLDPSEREHLTDLLARPAPARRAPTSPQRVRPGLHLMLQTLDHVPAFILGRRTDILASNRLAREVLTDFDALPAPRRNLARYYLLDPDARERVGDWEQIAAETVAILRLEAGRSPQDRQLADLVGELTLKSPEFSTWWNDHRVLRRTHGAKYYHHPLVGELHFSYESFQVPGDTDQTLCVYNVEPASDTTRALQLLTSWTAPQPTGTPERGA
ncbi:MULTISPECIES: helix-turn-helix transcriptional regulator [unclassified Streptomyces]|uniref:helix-turn-helix transcriptional regulator n=1 Tax=unclassified Streptomyces TaxID=2593676 RepID=UPI002E811461|nr:helix-turn-helix transcriptional regulator [Streptomyces sp. NBC_00589]WTI42312.1 helix-turn-helix transcriptional regulator [Streptomyces sp. NBC_00775]WUB24006.1 helix-turn-helix transcriptional regulator [Streptomyces sp. NBC_00589]